MKRYRILIGILFLFICAAHAPVNAEHEFTSSFNNTYEVFENGITKVTQQITLTNQTTDYRASKYKFIIKSPDINNISARDKGGALKLDVKKTADSTEIEAVFNEIVVGKNQNLNWTLVYETGEYAQNYGAVWEINIPGLPKDDDLALYTVKLITPDSFGKPLYSSPPPQKPLVWTMNDIGQGAISVLYGEKQNYSFFLKYHLTNKKPYPIRTEIALPMDTSMQKVFISDISPKPLDVTMDRDGNWLAQYNLELKESITVKVSGIVNLHFYPDEKVTLTNDEKLVYTKPQKYWESDDPAIKKLAAELKTPENIYTYVSKTLSYDYDKIDKGPVERLGAKKALSSPKNAICMEFSDLFIAIARAAGIPSRELDGYAYTTNPRLKPVSLDQDILHSWPEYYDEEKMMWIQIDPTWANTTEGVDYFNKLDLNHFAFVQKGENSEYPIPAGSYRENYKGKDVQVDIVSLDSPFSKGNRADVLFSLPGQMYAGFPYSVEMGIANNTGRLLAQYQAQMDSPDFLITPPGGFSVGKLPPYAVRSYHFSVKSKSLLDRKESSIFAVYQDEKHVAKTLLMPVIFAKMSLILIGGGIGVIIIIFTFAKITRRISLQKRGQ